ncbi:MAG TPA: PQQ-binding-like beta-propeller repeat protein [Ktedonobacteraceae bacterium]|nr:PQQ-binding-like beta-propeller repeat protein [Ktedonobacteraceae bacterium]
MHSINRRVKRKSFALCIFALAVMLASCSSTSPAPVVVSIKAPPATLAAGEPILPYSQILLHDAPLPLAADYRVDRNSWTLANYDTSATRAVTMPDCCSASPAPLWFLSLGTPLLTSPLESDGLLYLLASDGYLYVLNAQSGAEQWRVAVGGQLTSDGLALGHGLLYLAFDGHYLVALDARSGQVRWRYDTVGNVRGIPLVIGREVLVSSGANSVFCLDALTGEEYWAFHSEDALAQFWPTRSMPIVANNTVYVALGASTEFNALSLRTGRKQWEANLHERMTGGPLLDTAQGLVYLVTWSGKVVAFDMHSGALRWQYQMAGASQASLALDSRADVLYTGDYNGDLYALDAATGQPRWHISAGSSINTAPLVLQTSQQTWLALATQGGQLQLFDALTGQQKAVWKLGELRASPVAAQGVLYQASLGDRGIFAFRL